MRGTRATGGAVLLGILLALGSPSRPLNAEDLFVRGDLDGSGTLNVTDAVRVLFYLFRDEADTLTCLDAADVDDDGDVLLTDAVYLLNWLFRGGEAPPFPFPHCDEDPTADKMSCQSYEACTPFFPFLEKRIAADGVYFVTDRSGSMQDSGELERAKQAISSCETGILEGMEATETGRETLAAEESEIAAERKRVGENEKVLEDREGYLSNEIARLREAREQVCAGLESPLLDRYQKILARRQPALILVSGETCSGCRVGIPAQDFIEILKAERIVTCGSCSRILLHAEKIGA